MPAAGCSGNPLPRRNISWAPRSKRSRFASRGRQPRETEDDAAAIRMGGGEGEKPTREMMRVLAARSARAFNPGPRQRVRAGSRNEASRAGGDSHAHLGRGPQQTPRLQSRSWMRRCATDEAPSTLWPPGSLEVRRRPSTGSRPPRRSRWSALRPPGGRDPGGSGGALRARPHPRGLSLRASRSAPAEGSARLAKAADAF